MGLLDQILGAALGGRHAASGGAGGGLGELLSGLAGGRGGGAGSLMTALLPVVVGMLANRGGGAQGGGLEGLLRQFQSAGLGRQADSWVSTGANLPISPDDLARVFGRERLSQVAAEAGVDEAQAGSGLASLLPELVNQLTPRGEVPASGEVDDALSSLRRSLGL